MHKKLSAELVSLAHSILQMKNREDVNALHEKARVVYEKLSVLKFVDTYIQTTPTATETKEEIVENIEEALQVEKESEEIVDVPVENTEMVQDIEEVHAVSEEPVQKVFSMEDMISDEEVKSDEEAKEESLKQTSLEDEFKDAISADVATQLFEDASKEAPMTIEAMETRSRSLNDKLFQDTLQIGLNDRIAFVKHLFEGKQEDFNRVLSQLNSFNSEKDAKNFINKMVKPDYDWSEKESYEERLVEIIERKYQ